MALLARLPQVPSLKHHVEDPGCQGADRKARPSRAIRPHRCIGRGRGGRCKAQQSSGEIAWSPVTGTLLASGFVLGPLLDGIHGTVHLLSYDVLRFDAFGLHSSLVVPPLLAAFYAVLGSLANLAGVAVGGPATTRAMRRCTPGFVALSIGSVAALLGVSALMYHSGAPYIAISAVLMAGCAANWALLDGTPQGLGLCALCAATAPLSELFIIHYLGWWHYLAPDLLGAEGLPSWVPWCYFFYAPSVVNQARWLNRAYGIRQQRPQ